MANTHGQFLWYELMTSDPDAARAFYTSVVGWGTRDASTAEMQYTLFTAGEQPIAGVMKIPDHAATAGVPPGWTGYVGVDDVDHSADHLKQLGGAEHVPPSDIPDVGRFAVVSDPQSARFGLIRWLDSSAYGSAGLREPGHVGWHELLAVDWSAALEFYSAMFGWQKADAIDMGDMGTYQLFSTGDQPCGGMFNKPPMVPMPCWLYYFNVAAIDAAAERVTKAGGKIANGPMEVPGGMWIVQCIDPQGAMFALVGNSR